MHKLKKTLGIFLVFLLLLSNFTLVYASPTESENPGPYAYGQEDVIPGEFVIKYKSPGMGILGKNSLDETDPGPVLYVVDEGKDVNQVLEELEKDPTVEYVEPNLRYRIFPVETLTDIDSDTSVIENVYEPNDENVTDNITEDINKSISESVTENVYDTYIDSQWGLDYIKAKEAWQVLEDSSVTGPVIVSVIDTGVDPEHPDLQERLLPGKTMLEARSDGSAYADTIGRDDHGHGTQVSGIIAALYNNSLGVAGVAGPGDIKILPLKVMDDSGNGSSFDIAEAVKYAADNEADIINLSLGGKYSKVLADAVAYAQEKGVLVVAAAGNSAANVDSFFPAALPGVLTVGAIENKYDAVADYSNWGTALDIVAPGSNILSTGIYIRSTIGDDKEGYYNSASGTSFSSPYVAGAAALYKLLYPEATGALLYEVLTATAEDMAGIGWDKDTGYGKLDVHAALTYSDELPVVKIIDPYKNNTVNGETQITVNTTDPEVTGISIYLDKVSEASKIAAVDVTGKSSISVFWDASTMKDGNYQLIAVAYAGSAEKGRDQLNVAVRNESTTGLVLEVLDPDGNRVPGADVLVYQKHVEESGEYDYDLIYSGKTNSSGIVRVPGTVAVDLEEFSVLVQGSFDFKDALEGNTLFMYQRLLEAPGAFQLTGDNAVPVQFSLLDQTGKEITDVKYFATSLDDKDVVMGTTTPLNEGKDQAPTVYIDPGRYNLYAFSELADGTYFLNRLSEKITAGSKEIIFDGRNTGELSLEAPTTEKVDNSLIYLYNDATNEAIGVNNTLVGDKLMVTAGAYNFMADLEISGDGQEKWLYQFIKDKPLVVEKGQKTEVKAGGEITLSLYEPDVATNAALAKSNGTSYDPENPYTIARDMNYFYTNHRFVDEFDNSLVGISKGIKTTGMSSLFVQKKVNSGESSSNRTLVYDGEEPAWQIQSYDEDINPWYKVNRKSDDKELYNKTFQNFFLHGFWWLGNSLATPGEFDVELKLEETPLSNGELKDNMTVNIIDNSYTMKIYGSDGQIVRPYILVYKLDEDGSNWEQLKVGWGSNHAENYGVFSMGSTLPFSKKENGNLAVIRYTVSNNEYAYIFRQFTDPSEISEVHVGPVKRTAFKPLDKEGTAIQAYAKQLRTIIYPAEVAGTPLNFSFADNSYVKEGIYLEAGLYHFTGRYKLLSQNGKVKNYYLLASDVTVPVGDELRNFDIVLDGRETAEIVLDADYKDYNDLRNANLFVFSSYDDLMMADFSAGDIFYVPAGVKYIPRLDLTFGDTEVLAHEWNYYLEMKGYENKTFAKGSTHNWQVGGDFSAGILLDKNSLTSSQSLSGQSWIRDEYGNRVVEAHVDNAAVFGINEEQQRVYEYVNGKGIEPRHEVAHEAGDSGLEEIYPHLIVYSASASGQATKVFGSSNESYFTGFNEKITGLAKGSYQAEISMASGPKGPITSDSSSGIFTLISSSGSSSGSDRGSSAKTDDTLVTPTKTKADAQSDAEINAAVAASGSVVAIKEQSAQAVSLTSAQVKTILNANKPLQVTMENAIFVIPKEALQMAKDYDHIVIEASPAGSVQPPSTGSPQMTPVGEAVELNLYLVSGGSSMNKTSRLPEPVRILLAVPEGLKEAAEQGDVNVYRYNEETAAWDYVGGEYLAQEEALAVELVHFSKYALFTTGDEMQVAGFGDIHGHWAQNDILYMAEKGYVKGVTETSFAPNRSITRAEFAALLVRTLDLTSGDVSAAKFSDLTSSHWAYNDIARVAAMGLLGGYEDGTFRPEVNISRQEIAAMVSRALKLNSSDYGVTETETQNLLMNFKDEARIASWARESVAVSLNAGIMLGNNNQEFAPQSNASRAEAVVILKRLLQVQ